MSIKEAFASKRMLVIDGALGTELENKGANIVDTLWSAVCLLRDPESIYQVHKEYYEAGADLAITATYNASFPGFKEHGLDQEKAEAMCRLSVELAQRARDDFWAVEANRVGRIRPFVCGSIGSYGAYLPAGEEFTGAYSLTEQEYIDWHRQMIKAIVPAKPDILAIETQCRLDEV